VVLRKKKGPERPLAKLTSQMIRFITVRSSDKSIVQSRYTTEISFAP
jgi:hypothetical protein